MKLQFIFLIINFFIITFGDLKLTQDELEDLNDIYAKNKYLPPKDCICSNLNRPVELNKSSRILENDEVSLKLIKFDY